MEECYSFDKKNSILTHERIVIFMPNDTIEVTKDMGDVIIGTNDTEAEK